MRAVAAGSSGRAAEPVDGVGREHDQPAGEGGLGRLVDGPRAHGHVATTTRSRPARSGSTVTSAAPPSSAARRRPPRPVARRSRPRRRRRCAAATEACANSASVNGQVADRAPRGIGVHLGWQARTLPSVDVRRIAHDDIEGPGRGGPEAGEKVALHDLHLETEATGVVSSERDRLGGAIDRPYRRVGALVLDRQSDGAGSRADVDDERPGDGRGRRRGRHRPRPRSRGAGRTHLGGSPTSGVGIPPRRSRAGSAPRRTAGTARVPNATASSATQRIVPRVESGAVGAEHAHEELLGRRQRCVDAVPLEVVGGPTHDQARASPRTPRRARRRAAGPVRPR